MKDYYRWAKEFSDKHIAPYADEIDREGKFPKEIFDKIAEEGFYISPEECQLSYNPLQMALQWNSLATREVNLKGSHIGQPIQD